MLCFAANSVITRYLVQAGYVAPFPLTVIRFLSGTLMLLLLTFLIPETFAKGSPRNSHLLGGVSLGAYAFAISYGYVYITAAAGALIFYSFVVLSMSSYSVLNDKEKLTVRLALGQTLGILGVVVITFGRITSVSPSGVLLMAVTGTSWGIYSVFGRRFENPFNYTYYSFLTFAGISLILSVVSLPVIGTQWTDISPPSLALALFMGMISTALSYVLWSKVLTRLRASQGGSAQLIVSILTSILGVLLLSEKLTLALIFGGTLIIVGIYINTMYQKSQQI